MNSFTIPSSEIVESLAEKSLDFHCHGIGRFDFTEIQELDLPEIENILSARKRQSILTLYLPKPNFEHFLDLMETFHQGKKAGKFTHIAGISVEGPMLASHGGTPEEGVWLPSKENWCQLAACGKKGLIYVVLSPDAELAEWVRASDPSAPRSVTWIAETLLDGGVLPAPGHFTKVDPAASALVLQSIFDVVADWGQGYTVTDHLFNDMPHNFKHSWRTPEEKIRREEEIKALKLDNWNLNNLVEKLGPVPAVMVRNAHKGLVKICQNCDGEHVDLAIVKKAVELVGAENMVMMTDSIESKKLAGRNLSMKEDSTLLYQNEGIVAAGSQNVLHQIENMFSIGLTLKEVEMISGIVPASIIKQHDNIQSETPIC